ncbi:MAG TPA: hemolysin III family protein [Streptosporangiaceae bacterium]|nr:hemolysin III family protein [Streptosporangiaceae bacterium]
MAVGALAYHRRRPDPCLSVFGYHEVFHAFVCAAATCQYAAIALFIACPERQVGHVPP